jgi:UDP-N-acetylglucosamine transferase subunit ALG13
LAFVKGHILYGVLNWGLGHATRSKSLIQALLQNNFKVTLASDGAALHWLKAEFPQLQMLELPPYAIRYAAHKHQLPSLVAQLPKIARAAYLEKKRVAQWQAQYHFTGLISDNRLGFWHPGLPTVYLSHQLNIPLKNGAALARWAHRSYYQIFNQVWVPDAPNQALSGKMSKAFGNLQFTGPLSQFSSSTQGIENSVGPYLALLSGPEPQRSILEAKLLEQMRQWPAQSFTLVRGVHTAKPIAPANVQVHNTLGTQALQELIQAAPLVISRSGYSSLMDYAVLGKKALLIPTPGQAEQEYLAQRHKSAFEVATQAKLNLVRQCSIALQKPGLNLQKQKISTLFSLFKGERK